MEYFLKWKGFVDAENIWKPGENLDCSELIEAFLNSLKAGLESEQIIGVKDSNGELMFLMKRKDYYVAAFMLAKKVNLKYPQIAIAFIEERQTWHSEQKDKPQ
ncbi:Chromobox protein-3 [Galemys pyrenaicus]|uniref:Chromobox protein-3 n=1 Tax=Galemys pyrenaicus TaxID=202257 RepID=A0A8J6A6F4_GALPY|nr:Chromobox protein-3 [Galemys pyrenaicus]